MLCAIKRVYVNQENTMPGDFDISDDDFAKELTDVLGDEAKQWREDMQTLLDAVKALHRKPLETLGDPEE